MLVQPFPLTDVVAFGVFLVCWLGYGHIAQWMEVGRPSLMSSVKAFRQLWIERMCERDNHIADATLLSNLLRGALFFASTTVLILGGLVALLGTAPKVAEVLAHLPFAASGSARIAEIKALVVIAVFVYAFFKFTWAAWQYNVLSILVGAMPNASDDSEKRARYAKAGGRIAALAGESYNSGIRAYYFSIPLMAWFIDWRLFVVGTVAVTIVIYRREYHSATLKALNEARDSQR